MITNIIQVKIKNPLQYSYLLNNYFDKCISYNTKSGMQHNVKVLAVFSTFF